MKRSSERLAITVPARITWKDASGAVRFASVTTRDVSEAGVFVECEAGAAIPLYRLVHLQLERSAGSNQQLPLQLREGRVLSAVWRVAPCRQVDRARRPAMRCGSWSIRRSQSVTLAGAKPRQAVAV